MEIEITKSLDLDVSRQNRIQAVVAKQYDTNSRFLKVQLKDSGIDIKVDDAWSVYINASRADGEARMFSGTVNADGTVTLPITYWMLELDAIVTCDVSIVSGDAKLTSLNFMIDVERANIDPSLEPSEGDDDYDVYFSLVSDMSQLKSDISEKLDTVESNINELNTELDKKLDAVTTEGTCDRVYRISKSGVQYTSTLDNAASEIDCKWGNIPRRYVRGAIYLPRMEDIPSSKWHRCAVRKDDVDALVEPLCRRVEDLECAASGNIYETVTDSGAASEKYIVGDALPYGVLSRVGGRSYTVWQESTELLGTYGSQGGVLLDAAQLASLFGVGSRFKLTAECEDEEALGGTYFTLSYFSTSIDSCDSISFGLDEEVTIPEDAELGGGYAGNQLSVTVYSEYGTATISGIKLHTSPREEPTAVTAVKLYGKNIADISLATAYSSGSVSVDGDSLIWSAGSKYYVELPISIPSGSTVTASCVCEGAEGDRIEKVTFITASGEEITTRLDTAITLHADVVKVRFCKYSQSTALTGDMRISELQVEYGDRASGYVPYAGAEPLAVLEIPEGVTGLEDYGHGTETLCNYLDLGEGWYYRYVDAELQALSEPQVTDVSDLLGEDADILALEGVGRVVFESAQGGEVPSVLSYKRRL